MDRMTSTVLTGILALVLTGCAELGLPTSQPPVNGRVVVQNGPGGTAVSATLTVGEARRLAIKHGVTGYRGLPPGIQRNLARGKPIPPGIARQMVPSNMLGEMPAVSGHEWRVAGRDLILVAIGTLIVVEILNDVFS